MLTAGFSSLGALAHPADDGEPTCATQPGPHGCYATLTEALEAVAEHDGFDTVIAAADANGPENPTPFNERITVDTPSVTICSAASDFAEAEQGQSTPPVVIAKSDELCNPKPASTVIQPSQPVDSVLEIDAADVTIRGFSIRYDGDTTGGFDAIKVNAPDARIADSQVRVAGGECSPDQSPCDNGMVDGIELRNSGAEVVRTEILNAQGSQGNATSAVGTHGINNLGPTTVTDVTIRGWIAGVTTWSPGLTIEDSTLQGNVRGLHIAEGPVQATNNTFLGSAAAVFVAGNNDIGLEELELRHNDLGLSNANAIEFKETRDDIVVDARANDWGVLGREVIQERFANTGDNTVLYMPYEDGQDDLHPPKPTILGSGNGLKDGACKPTQDFLTLQGAIDAVPVPDAETNEDSIGRCVIMLHEDAEDYDPATVEGKTVHIAAEPLATRSGEVPQDAHIVARDGAPALTFGPGTAGSTVEQVRVTPRGTGATGILLDQAEAVTLTEATITGTDNPSNEGIVIHDSTDIRVESSVLTGLGQGVQADGSDRVEVADNQMHVAKRAVDARNTGSLTVSDNTMSGQGPVKDVQGRQASSGVFLGPGTTEWTVEDNTMENWGFAGVHVTSSADPGTIESNTIRDTWRFGIYAGATSDLDIVDNDVERTGLNGINLERTSDVLVFNNSISLDILPGTDLRDQLDPENLADTDPFREPTEIPAAGLWVQGAQGVTIEDNQFAGDAKDGILVTNAPGDDGQQPGLEPIRHNEFVLVDATEDAKDNPAAVKVPSVQALRVGNQVTTVGGEEAQTTLDAQLNDWGVYEWQLVEQRAQDDSGEIWIDQLPFLLPNGAHGLPVMDLT